MILPHLPPPGNVGSAEGDRRRDAAHDGIRAARPALARRVQRSFLRHLLATGPSCTDAVRTAVELPPHVDPRLVGAAVRGLRAHGLIRSVGRQKSCRPEARGRQLDVWGVADPLAVGGWLAANPEPAAAAIGGAA